MTPVGKAITKDDGLVEFNKDFAERFIDPADLDSSNQFVESVRGRLPDTFIAFLEEKLIAQRKKTALEVLKNFRDEWNYWLNNRWYKYSLDTNGLEVILKEIEAKYD